MTEEICEAVTEQQAGITELLISTFGSGLPPCRLASDLLRWKFFSPRRDFPGGRSYVIADDREIIAHACAWPLSFPVASGEICGCHIIDWAARPGTKGKGVQLYQHLMSRNGFVISIGGSSKARSLHPKLGLQSYGTLDLLALVARPWKQYRCDTRRSEWRKIARLARNTLWSALSNKVSRSNWTIARIENIADLPERSLRIPPRDYCLGIRSAFSLQYLMECPAMKCSLFTLSKSGVPRGYFLLNEVHGQSRIIDLTVDSESHQDWAAAYRAAVASAITNEEICEVTAASSLRWLSTELKDMGFRLRDQIPVTLYDPTSSLLRSPPLHLRMTDSDLCFLQSPDSPFLT